MRRQIKKILFAAGLMAIFSTIAMSANPRPGWYGDSNGTGELVLDDYQLARDLVRTSGRPSSDPNVQSAISRLVSWARVYAPVVANVSRASSIVSAFMLANQLQMMNETSAPNYEVYGFTMYRWVPLTAKAYSYPDYTLLREDGSQAVYVVVGDAKFWVRSTSYPYYRPSAIKVVPRGRLSNWKSLWRTSLLLKEQSNPTVYLTAFATINPQYTWVSSINQQGFVRRAISGSAFARYGLSFSNVKVLPDGAFDSPNPYIPRGFDIL